MTTEELARRVDTLEASVLELRGRIESTPPKQKRGILSIVGAMADRPEFDDAIEFGRYFRLTGREAPPDWKPGDPIPEPDWEE